MSAYVEIPANAAEPSDVTPSGWLGGTGYGLTFEVVNKPQGQLLLSSPGTFGHGGAFGTEGWMDPDNDLFAS